jgi:hypothetical protein
MLVATAPVRRHVFHQRLYYLQRPHVGHIVVNKVPISPLIAVLLVLPEFRQHVLYNSWGRCVFVPGSCGRCRCGTATR